MRAVLDTSVMIATDVPELAGELAISAATVAELHFGVMLARSDAVRAERLRRLAVVTSGFAPLPIDARVSISYGALAAQLARTGRNPRARAMDLLIAATAHAHGARLYTRNAADLKGLEEELEVVAV